MLAKIGGAADRRFRRACAHGNGRRMRNQRLPHSGQAPPNLISRPAMAGPATSPVWNTMLPKAGAAHELLARQHAREQCVVDRTEEGAYTTGQRNGGVHGVEAGWRPCVGQRSTTAGSVPACCGECTRASSRQHVDCNQRTAPRRSRAVLPARSARASSVPGELEAHRHRHALVGQMVKIR